MSRRSIPLAVVGAGLLGAGPAGASVERVEPRVVVADGAAGRVHVAGLDGERRGRPLALPRADPAYLTPLEDGRHVAAVQYEGDAVSIVDSGTWTEPHGDHVHSHVARPRLTPFRFTGPEPSHVVSHGGAVTIFADGTGTAHGFALEDMARRAGSGTTVPTGKPHHGVALRLGDAMLVTAPDPALPDGELPVDVSVRDAAGTETGRLGACPELHGEAGGEDWAVFACADGILSARLQAGSVRAVKVPYPGPATAEQRAWGVQATAGGRHLIGDFGPRALVRIDRTAGTATALRLPAVLAGFAVAGRTVHALTADGRVHRLDAVTGRSLASRRVVRAFDAGARGPQPEIDAGAGRVVVSDPRRSRVLVLRARSLERHAAIRVPGRPQRLVITGSPAH